MMPIMTVTFIIKFIGAVEYYGNSEEVRLICFANLHFYIVAFLYYEVKVLSVYRRDFLLRYNSC